MGISVPIGAEHYSKLKTISDELGLGVKKAIEYLVSYYWQKEMEQSTAKPKEAKPIVQSKEVEPIVQPKEVEPIVQPKEVEPIVQTIEVKPIRQLLEELSREYDLLPSNEITADSLFAPQKITHNSNIIEEEDTSKAKVTIWPPQDIIRSCSCGSQKKPGAKYCSNCGNLL